MATKTNKHPLILDGTYFEVIESDSSGNVKAKCVTCNSIIKGTFKTTSNFTTHLQASNLIIFY